MGSSRRRYAVLLFIAFAFSCPTRRALAQLPVSVSGSARASLITVAPGDAVYNAFGHSALRFTDPSNGLDVVFNYGTFDSTDPWFVPKFAYGDMHYFVSFDRMDILMRSARIEDRSVIEQRLNLQPSEVADLYFALRENARPENRFYQYDFVRDNCSTRLLDMVEFVADLDLAVPPDSLQSVRSLVDDYVHHRPPLDLGIDLVFGASMDRPIAARERTFLPDYLMSTFDGARRASTGEPLVVRTDTLFQANSETRRGGGLVWLTIVAWIVALAGISMTWVRGRGTRRGNRLAMVLDRILFGVTGFIGGFLLFMWFGTMHSVTASNWNIIWAFPGHLIVALAWRRFERKSIYMKVGAIGTLLFLCAVPIIPQTIPPAAFPWIVLLIWRMWRMWRNR